MTLTYNEFFLWIDDYAASHNCELAFSDKDFFYNLVTYCEEHGYYDYEKAVFCVEGSVRSFKDLFGFSSVRLVQEAISSLCSVGILSFEAVPPAKTIYYIDFPYIELALTEKGD